MLTAAAVSLAIIGAACGSDDSSGSPTSAAGTPASTTPDSVASDSGEPAPSTAPVADASPARAVFEQLVADQQQLDAAVLAVVRDADTTTWQNQILAVRTALFDMDATLRSLSEAAPDTQPSVNSFLTAIAPAFTALDELITLPEVDPALRRGAAEVVGETQRMIANLAGELDVVAGGDALPGPLGDRLITLDQLDAAGLEGNSVIWYNLDKTPDTNCGSPGTGVQPLFTEGLYFNTNTGANGWDMVQLFASAADAQAYMEAFAADTSCHYSDTVVEPLEGGFRISTPQGGGSVMVVQGRVVGRLFEWTNVLFFAGGGADDPAAGVIDLLLA